MEKLAAHDTINARIALYEVIRSASLIVPFADKQHKELIYSDAAGQNCAVAFCEFSKFTRWMQHVGSEYAWSEEAAAEFIARVANQSPSACIILDPDKSAGIIIRRWELDALLSKTEPVVRGSYNTLLSNAAGVKAFGKLPVERPTEQLKEDLSKILSQSKPVKVAFLTEAVFEPLTERPSVTLVVHTASKMTSDDELVSRLVQTLKEHTGLAAGKVLFNNEPSALRDITRVSHCVYERS